MSTIKCTTIQNLAGVEVYTAKAWVNFNGTGVVAIRASGNVSSITDNGSGDYTVNFATAMTDVNYTINVTSGNASAGGYIGYIEENLTAPTTTSVRIALINVGVNKIDSSRVCITIFR